MLNSAMSYVGSALPYLASAGSSIGLPLYSFVKTHSYLNNNPDHYKATEVIAYASCIAPVVAAAYVHATSTLDYALLASSAIAAGCYAVNSICRKDIKEGVALMVGAPLIAKEFGLIRTSTLTKPIISIMDSLPSSAPASTGFSSILSYVGTGIYNMASSCVNHTSTLLTSHNSYPAVGAHMAGVALSFYLGVNMLSSTLSANKELDTRIKYLEDLNNKIIAQDPAHYSLNDTNAAIARAKNNAGYGTYGIVASVLPIAAPLLLSATPAAIIAGAGIAANVFYLGGIVRDAAKETRTRYSEIRTGAQALGIAV